jgi:hypothetical protein
MGVADQLTLVLCERGFFLILTVEVRHFDFGPVHTGQEVEIPRQGK